jgi:hypothetical protein
MNNDKTRDYESVVQEQFDSLNAKLSRYNSKINNLVVDGKTKTITTRTSFFKIININYLIIGILVLLLVVFFVLQFVKPDFVMTSELNENTHFIEKELSVFKLVVFTILITVCISALGIGGFYIYKTMM